jgi:pyridoxamine 5'-phosphate oxidase
VTIRDLLRTLPVFDRPLPGFDPEPVPDEPVSLFVSWLGEAADAKVVEPHVMTLSTVDAQGRPDARVVILRNVSDEGWQFTASAAGVKGAQLAANPQAALSFYWREQGRQVRVRGQVSAAEPSVSAADFLAQSEGSRIADLVGRQSTVLRDSAELARAMEAARQRLADDPQLVEPDHTVYLLTPAEVEFWQGDHQRRHIRLRYRRSGPGWVTERLWP